MYVSLNTVLGLIAVIVGSILTFIGSLSMKEWLIYKERAASLPFIFFGIPGIILIAAGWRLLKLF